jgi:hypothetical protein
MHAIIGDPSREDKATKSAALLRLDHYLDTVSWSFQTRWLAHNEWKRLRDCYGAVPHVLRRREPVITLTFQCPQPDLIDECEVLEAQYDGNVSRLDIACDVRPGSTTLDYIEQTKLLWRSMILRRRAKGPFKPVPNDDGTIGTFWNPFAEGEKPPARDIVLYPDSCSKLPHQQAVAHFDFRLREHARRKALREQGIGPMGKSLKLLDPSITLRDNIMFVRCDMERETREYFKTLVQGQSLEHARRMIEHEKRWGQIEYVQRLRDQYPQMRMQEDRNSVLFSRSLKWGAVSRDHMKHANDDGV